MSKETQLRTMVWINKVQTNLESKSREREGGGNCALRGRERERWINKVRTLNQRVEREREGEGGGSCVLREKERERESWCVVSG